MTDSTFDNPRLQAALEYARLGWHVLPLHHVTGGRHSRRCSCGKPNCKDAGKHPLSEHGVSDATTDEALIRQWWREHPDANIGVATGRRSGIIVADIDPRHQGDESWRQLLSEHGDLDPTPHTLTGGGGDHYYLHYPAGGEIASGKLAQGVDLQSDGRYVVAPPSMHLSGYEYTWDVGGHVEDVRPIELPNWLTHMVAAKAAPATDDHLAEEWEHDVPPVRLPAWAMALWTGENVVDATDGEERPHAAAADVDRSETLWRIGKALASAGADGPLIAAALKNRDIALGFEKYSNRRNGYAAREYNRIAAKAMTEYVAPGAPVLKLGNTGRSQEDEPEEGDGPATFEEVSRWVIVPASGLDPNGEKVDWLLEGYLARGAMTLLIGLWKAGKTTFLAHLAKATEKGGMFCGQTLSRIKVLIITEEHQSLWAERRDELGLADNVHFMVRPFLGKPDLRTWRQFIRFIAGAVVEHSYDLVVLDPLTSQAPIEDENKSGEMTTVIVEFRRILEAGASLLVSHHPNKAQMGQGRASRGSGALPGFVDILLEFGRYQQEHPEDTRRVMMGLSRYKETPPEVVLDLTDNGYEAVGNVAGNASRGRRDVIVQMMSKTAVSREAIRNAWPPDCGVPKPSTSQLKYDLAALVGDGSITTIGTGKKGSPLLYTQAQGAN